MEKRPSKEQLATFKKNANDQSLSAEVRAKFQAIVDKFENVGEEVVDAVEGKKERKPRTPKATTERKPRATKQTGDDIEKAKAEIKARTGKTEEECEKIVEEYRALRTKSQERKKKEAEASKTNVERINKLKKEDKVIEGTNEKTADAVIETTTKDVADKIEKQIEAVEEKAETEAKKEVEKEMPKVSATEKKKAVKEKVEEKVKEKTKTIVKRVVIDTSALLTTIAESLGKFDKDSQKEFLIKLRSDIDKLISKYSFGGLTDGGVQVMNIQQSNLSSSSVNPTMFGGGGGVEGKKSRILEDFFIGKHPYDEFIIEQFRKDGTRMEYSQYNIGRTAGIERKLPYRLMIGLDLERKLINDTLEKNAEFEVTSNKNGVKVLKIKYPSGVYRTAKLVEGERYDFDKGVKVKYSNGGGVEAPSEEDAKKELEKLESEGKITLSIGNHGLIFMQIVKTGNAMVSSFKKSYESYLDALKHYYRVTNRFTKGGAVSSDQRRKGYVHGYKFDNPNDRETFTNYLEREDIDYYTRNGVVATKMAISNKELRKIGISQEFSEFNNGGGVEGITPELNRRVKERAEEIYRTNKGKTKKDFDNAFNNAIREFGYSPQIYHQTMREIGAEYDDAEFREFGNGGGVEGKRILYKVVAYQKSSDYDNRINGYVIADDYLTRNEAEKTRINFKNSYPYVEIEEYMGKDPYKMTNGGGVGSLNYNDILAVLKEKVEEGVDNIPNYYESASDFKGEEIEHESRDGFIPYTNGGYEAVWFETLGSLFSSGYSLPTEPLDTEKDRQIDYNLEYARESFGSDYPEIVEELGEENINYNSLYDAGYQDEAEELSNAEMDMMFEDTIMMRILANYYNPSNSRAKDGKHTIRLFGDVNLESPYHRVGNLDDSYEYEFTFDSIDELKREMDKGIKMVNAWFNGDMYNESNAEMKIRKMKRGGGVYNRSWHQDHSRHNKRENYEVPMSSRKKAHGGTIEERMRMRRGM